MDTTDVEPQKRAAAQAALELVRGVRRLGVGTGSTAGHFVSLLAASDVRPEMIAASSERTADMLSNAGISVTPLAQVDVVDAYVDGADAIDPDWYLLKGRGGALTREKLLAAAAGTFVVIADESKLVATLEGLSVAIEVLPVAVGSVLAHLASLGGRATARPEASDNAGMLLDVAGLNLSAPAELERELAAVPGVIGCGVFALRRPDVVLIGGAAGVRRLVGPGALPDAAIRSADDRKTQLQIDS